MADNRPKGRERNVSGEGKGVNKRGSGLGTGPVGRGSSSGTQGGSKPQGSQHRTEKQSRSQGRPVYSTGGNGSRRGSSGLIRIVLIAVILIFASRSGILGSLLGGVEITDITSTDGNSTSSTLPTSSSGGSSSLKPSISDGSGYSSLFNGSYSNGWYLTDQQGKLDTTVADGAREKYTQIVGNGNDTITIMVYMCGTDLESKNGMATSDLQEMINADLSENINLIVYTGGCSGWRNNVISSSVNQIYQVTDDGLRVLKKDAGTDSMTRSNTLSSFISWTAQEYPADRYELIFWDHGGGSVTGYGYDEKNSKSGSMSLAGINQALKDGGVRFDFIGFDACLMATVENALMLDSYADYLIASEETEPGVGWYYTDWLTALSKNTSMETTELGKRIIDSFVETCNKTCQGQKTTLSLVDLAELSAVTPEYFTEFSRELRELMENQDYTTISNARSKTREFSRNSKIDQTDLVHFALNLNTEDSKALADAVLGAVKYNRTSSNMTNAYGLSIYFPYRNMKYVDSMSRTYDEIDMDEEYISCIREFASLTSSGQAVSGTTQSAAGSLFGDFAGAFGGSSSDSSAELVGTLLSAFLNGRSTPVDELNEENSDFLKDTPLSEDELAEYLAANRFEVENLKWVTEDGKQLLKLSEEQWSQVRELELNMFYDDGEGYVDLGVDTVFDFDDDGNLIADAGTTWLSINGQPIAYYHMDTVEEDESYTITGRVPCLLNGDRCNLILVFDSENPEGYIAGANYDYESEDIQVVAKNLTGLEAGDTLDFLCDYYTYDGTYSDSYYLGETMTVSDEMQISDTYVGGPTVVMYRIVDQFQAQYWTEALKRN